MPRLQRRPRARCRLPCEIGERRQRGAEACVVSLSEGGLGIETSLRLEQGEPVRLRILPHRAARAVTVDGIAWNDQLLARSRAGSRLRLIGVVVSDPPRDFLALLGEVQRRHAAPRERRASVVSNRPTRSTYPPAPRPGELEMDLPRSREPLPPPKPEPEETLPPFRVRLKQVGGPRTRIVSVRARSLAHAEECARAELNGPATDGGTLWEVLDVSPGGALAER